MDLALPPMPFSAVFVPEQGQVAPLIPVEMQNGGLVGKDRRITLPPGVVQVIVSWRGVDPLYLRHFIPGSSLAYETVASIPAASSPENRSTGVLTFSSAESHQIQVIHAGGGQWNQGTIDNDYVVGVQVMPVGTAADITGGGSLLRVDNSVGTRVFLGDQMIYGDTGWRVLPVRDEYSGVTVTARRTNSMVTIAIAGNVPAGVARTIADLPNGFGNYGYRGIGTIRASAPGLSTPLTHMGTYNGPRILGFLNVPTSSSFSVSGTLTWTTSDAWPTSLPGTSS